MNEPVEIYRLIFRHEYIDEEGNYHQVEKPIIGEYVVSRYYDYAGSAAVVNEIYERLGDYIFKELERSERR